MNIWIDTVIFPAALVTLVVLALLGAVLVVRAWRNSFL
jgi:hypothetical protein